MNLNLYIYLLKLVLISIIIDFSKFGSPMSIKSTVMPGMNIDEWLIWPISGQPCHSSLMLPAD